MSAAFGLGAARLAGLTSRLLGWRPDEFWHATPAEIATILAPAVDSGSPLSRKELNQMMERDHA